jgi:hypothetical protein
VAILCSLLLREVYHLPLRATQGLACSLLRLLEVNAALITNRDVIDPRALPRLLKQMEVVG